MILKEDREKAIQGLGKKYPNIADSAHSKVTEQTGEAFWQTYFKQTTFQQVIETILDGYLSQDQDKPITLTLMDDTNSKGVRLIIDIVNHRATDYQTSKSQKTLFALNQLFYEKDGKPKVHIETVTATGGGKKLFAKSLLPLFKTLNISEIILKASRIGGGDEGIVAWARYGFIPSKEDWITMQKKAQEEIGNNEEDWAQKVRSIVAKESPRSIRELVFLSWQNKGQVRSVLDTMLRSTVSWFGTLDMNHHRDLSWIEKYANGAKVEEFAELLG